MYTCIEKNKYVRAVIRQLFSIGPRFIQIYVVVAAAVCVEAQR